MKRYIVLIICVFHLFNGSSQDSLRKTSPVKFAAVPVVFIGYGLSVMGNHGIFYSSMDARRDATTRFPGFHTTADNYIQYIPMAGMLTLNLTGLHSTDNFKDLVIISALGSGLDEGVVHLLKNTTHVQRPDGSSYNSFPSGHTSFSFMSAELFHQEYKDSYPLLSCSGYLVSTTVGALRILNNRHWLSDVAVGAGIGILAGKTVYYLYPKLKKKANSIIRH